MAGGAGSGKGSLYGMQTARSSLCPHAVDRAQKLSGASCRRARTPFVMGVTHDVISPKITSYFYHVEEKVSAYEFGGNLPAVPTWRSKSKSMHLNGLVHGAAGVKAEPNTR